VKGDSLNPGKSGLTTAWFGVILKEEKARRNMELKSTTRDDSTAREPRVPRLEPDQVTDPGLKEVLAEAERYSTPKPAWFLTLGHSPEMAVGYYDYWHLTHRRGRVEHEIKELMRIAISTLLGCEFCADQRSNLALEEGLDEEQAVACAMPDFQHPDPRTRAALGFARAITLDSPAAPVDWDPVYADLHEVFDEGEIVELGCFAAIALGGVKLSRSFTE
jgi:AhpD family alkylhydroperoxidase